MTSYDDDFKYCIEFLATGQVHTEPPKQDNYTSCVQCGSHNLLHEHLSGQPFYVVCSDCGVMRMDNIVSCKEFNEYKTSVNRVVLPYSRKVYLKRKIRFKLGLQNVTIPLDLIKVVREQQMNIKKIREYCEGPLKRYKRHAYKVLYLANQLEFYPFPHRLYEHLCFFLGHFERYYTPGMNKKKFVSVDFFALRLMQWMYKNCSHEKLGYDPQDHRWMFKKAICPVTKERNDAIWYTIEADHVFDHFLSVYR